MLNNDVSVFRKYKQSRFDFLFIKMLIFYFVFVLFIFVHGDLAVNLFLLFYFMVLLGFCFPCCFVVGEFLFYS
ncbi:hypothetical protein D5F51_16175 [Yersinia hibernica]|uniref:Uncharacterized protein n=1 Tax=Yersinia hibernica TaxID=2339259 RepID=A0ABX5R2V0_9GAMM|nr:hypothetical protein D5F51_16175 [Yersinia hibernica]